MFDLIRKKWKLGKAERERDRISKLYDKEIEAARRRKANQEDIDKVISQMFFELDLCEDEISKLRSSILISQANRFLLPIPSGEDSWEESKIDSRRYLTQESQRLLMVSIRTERKERSELFRLWLFGLTGLIGALSGLAAVLLSHKW